MRRRIPALLRAEILRFRFAPLRMTLFTSNLEETVHQLAGVLGRLVHVAEGHDLTGIVGVVLALHGLDLVVPAGSVVLGALRAPTSQPPPQIPYPPLTLNVLKLGIKEKKKSLGEIRIHVKSSFS